MDEVIEDEYQKTLKEALEKFVVDTCQPQGESSRDQDEEFQEDHVDYEPSPTHGLFLKKVMNLLLLKKLKLKHLMVRSFINMVLLFFKFLLILENCLLRMTILKLRSPLFVDLWLYVEA